MLRMIKRIGKGLIRISSAFKAFAQVLSEGGIKKLEVSILDKHNELENRKIVITGGGSGIGLAVARCCVNAGADVLITGRNERKLREAVHSIGSDSISYLVWDASDVDTADLKVQECERKLGGQIDAVVNNAGVPPHEFFPSVSGAEWDRIYSTNSKGIFFTAQAFCKYWINHPSDEYRHLINISSQGGFVGALYPYRMSKWDIRGLTEGLGVQMAPQNVLVNGVAPGVVRTAMQSFAVQQGDNAYCNQNLLKRYALPEEVAELIIFMLSGACNFMVGQTILLDGGYSIKN